MGTDEDPAAENALGGFLRARRAQLRPEATGLPTSGRRRVPGLRREEVATLAGVSTDYYMRLEQGRERHPSQQVLEAVARALRLDDEAVAHLYRVATPTARRTRRAPRVERVAPHLRRLLDNWPDTPAFVLGPALDVLTHNALAAALHSGFERFDNLARMVFLDPAGRGFYRDWERAANSCVAEIRAAYGYDPDFPRIAEVVDTLGSKSPEFAELWARHEVKGKTQQAKNLAHPEAGALEIQFSAFTVNGAPHQQLVVYQAEPASATEAAFAELRSRADRPAPGHNAAPMPA
ncbi:helix-turn-helix transcriptional regulator [Streptomyces mirabilis]